MICGDGSVIPLLLGVGATITAASWLGNKLVTRGAKLFPCKALSSDKLASHHVYSIIFSELR